jgi:membrane protease YdiL (CAAX protease family)
MRQSFLFNNDRLKKWQAAVYCLLSLLLVRWLLALISEWLARFESVPFDKASFYLPYYAVIIKVVLLFPIFEELVFRLPFKFTPRIFAWWIVVTSFYLIFRFELIHVFSQTGTFFFIRLLIFLVIIGAAICLMRDRAVMLTLTGIHFQYRKSIFWFFSVLFALGHLGRFSFASARDSFVILFFLSGYFLLGVICGYARLRLGVLASIGLHILNNSIPYLIVLYASLRAGVNYFPYM